MAESRVALDAQESTRKPAFYLYAKDWLTGEATRAMCAAEKGAFIDLLCWAWEGTPPCSLSSVEDELKMLSGLDAKQWRRYGAKLRALFLTPAEIKKRGLPAPPNDGRLRNPKQWQVFTEMAEYTEKKREAGRKGADARWHPHAGANGSAIGIAMAGGVANRWPSSPSASTTGSKDPVVVKKETRERGERRAKGPASERPGKRGTRLPREEL